MTTPETSPRRAVHVDRVLSVSAGVAAVAAVAISLYQAALARQQLRASAWPYVTQSNSYASREQPYTRVIANDGVGPARIRSFVVLVDGRSVTRWNDAVRALTGEGEPALVYSSFGRGSVLPPGTTRTLLTLPPGERAGSFWLAAQTRLTTIVCYCSVYDECWRADARADEPVRVRECASDPKSEFRE